MASRGRPKKTENTEMSAKVVMEFLKPNSMKMRKQKPGFRARWVRKDRVEDLEDSGYVVSNPEEWGRKTGEKKELILMETSIEINEKRKLAKQVKTDMLSGVKKLNEGAKQQISSMLGNDGVNVSVKETKN